MMEKMYKENFETLSRKIKINKGADEAKPQQKGGASVMNVEAKKALFD